MIPAGASAPAAKTWLSGGDNATRDVADIKAKTATPRPRFSNRSRRLGSTCASRSLVLLASLAPPAAARPAPVNLFKRAVGGARRD